MLYWGHIMNKIIYEKLKEVARNQSTITYGEVGSLVGLDMEDPSQRNDLANLLGEISTYEYENDRPLLSMVVVHSEDRTPGKGVFNLARQLGAQKPDEEDIIFFAKELIRVHQHWKA